MKCAFSPLHLMAAKTRGIDVRVLCGGEACCDRQCCAVDLGWAKQVTLDTELASPASATRQVGRHWTALKPCPLA